MRIIIEIEGFDSAPRIIVEHAGNNSVVTPATEAPPAELLRAAEKLGAFSAGRAQFGPERLAARLPTEASSVDAGQAPPAERPPAPAPSARKPVKRPSSPRASRKRP